MLVDPADVPNAGKSATREFQVLLYEFKADLNAYLAASGRKRRVRLAEVIAFNEAHREEEMPYFGQESS